MPENIFDYKSLTIDELKWAYQGVQFKREPRWHQYVTLAYAADKKRVGLWHGVGSGKTLASYWIAQLWGMKRILVICPGSALSAWMRDLPWTEFTGQIISGETSERKQKIRQGQNISVVQYEWLKTIFGKFVQKPNTQSKVWVIDQEALKNLGNFDCIIYDEIHKCNNHGSLQSAICLELSRRVGYTIGLSGTPVDRVLLELFNIYRVLDLGATFGWSFWNYRQTHFHQCGYDWEIRKNHKDVILERMKRNSLSFSREECFDLPKCMEDVIQVPASEEFRKLEQRVLSEEAIAVGGSREVFVQYSTKVSKLKQLTDGFIYLKDDNSRKVYVLKENPKLDALVELLDCGQKIIVFHEFEEAGNLISQELDHQRVKHSRIRGGLTPEERIKQEYEFQQGDSQVMIGQISASAEGWDGFAARIVVFFDIVASPKLRTQCIGRMLRSGQTQETLVVELVVEGSVNEATKEAQGDRITEVESIMAYIRKRTN